MKKSYMIAIVIIIAIFLALIANGIQKDSSAEEIITNDTATKETTDSSLEETGTKSLEESAIVEPVVDDAPVSIMSVYGELTGYTHGEQATLEISTEFTNCNPDSRTLTVETKTEKIYDLSSRHKECVDRNWLWDEGEGQYSSCEDFLLKTNDIYDGCDPYTLDSDKGELYVECTEKYDVEVGEKYFFTFINKEKGVWSSAEVSADDAVLSENCLLSESKALTLEQSPYDFTLPLGDFGSYKFTVTNGKGYDVPIKFGEFKLIDERREGKTVRDCELRSPDDATVKAGESKDFKVKIECEKEIRCELEGEFCFLDDCKDVTYPDCDLTLEAQILYIDAFGNEHELIGAKTLRQNIGYKFNQEQTAISR